MRRKLSTITSTAIPLDMSNIDTDQILPARYLKAITREGFADKLFRDWRFDGEDKPVADFVLNDSRYNGEILIVGYNFGGGSSREHAAWALADYGFTVVISSSFADIFKANALNNSLVPVEVSESFLNQLMETVQADPTTVLEVDLPSQTVSVSNSSMKEKFAIDAYKKTCLINGYDDIDYLVSLKPSIETYEKNRKDDYSLA